MKKLLTVLLLSAALVLQPRTATAALAVGQIMDVVFTGTGTYDCSIDGGTTRKPCDLSGYRTVSVQVTCNDTCSGEVDMQQRNSPNDPFSGTVIQFLNPGTNDQGYSNSGYGQVQFVVPGGWTGTGHISLVELKN